MAETDRSGDNATPLTPSERHVVNALALLRQEAARLAEPFDDSHGTHYFRGRRRAWCDGVRTAREVALEKVQSAVAELELAVADLLSAEGEDYLGPESARTIRQDAR